MYNTRALRLPAPPRRLLLPRVSLSWPAPGRLQLAGRHNVTDPRSRAASLQRRLPASSERAGCREGREDLR